MTLDTPTKCGSALHHRKSSMETADMTLSEQGSLNSTSTTDTSCSDEDCASSVGSASPESFSLVRPSNRIMEYGMDRFFTDERRHCHADKSSWVRFFWLDLKKRISRGDCCGVRPRTTITFFVLVLIPLCIIVPHVMLSPFESSNYLFKPHRLEQRWKTYLDLKGPAVLKSIREDSDDVVQTSYTIRLTGTRLDLVRRSIDAHARCPQVGKIQIQGLPSPCPDFSAEIERWGKVSTDAILLLGDDVLFSCEELERAFRMWRLHQDRLVGFFPALHGHETYDGPNGERQLEYNFVNGGVDGKYSLVSSRATFVHSLFVETFEESNKSETTVTKEACGPFGLSIHATAISSMPPIAVAAEPVELRRTCSLLRKMGGSSWSLKQPKEVSACLHQWVEGHGIRDLPLEESMYLGV